MSSMGKPLVVIADPDASYVAPLECKFLEELRDIADLEVVTDDEYRRRFFSAPHDIEVLVIAQEWYCADLDMQNIAHMIVLTEEQHSDLDRTCSLVADFTFKYGNFNVIYNKVVGSSSKLRAHDASDKEAKVIVFYSPVGGSGTTSAAIATAVCLRETYKRVLFVDAEYVQTFSCFLRSAKPAPNDMVRDMASMQGDLFEKMSPYIVSDCFDYLPPLRSGLSSFGLEFDVFARFIVAARDSGCYDYLVVDTDSVFNTEKADLFALADRIVVTVTQDEKALHKTVLFLDNLDHVDDRYHFVCNKHKSGCETAFSSSAGGSAIVLDGFVEYDEKIADSDAMLLGEVAGFKRLAYSMA